MPQDEELFEIEKKFWTEGPQAYLDHAAERCLVVFAQMVATMERTAIAQSAEAGRWRDVKMTPKESLQASPEMRLIAYECEATRKDGKALHVHASSGYVKQAGGWKLVFHQQTEL